MVGKENPDDIFGELGDSKTAFNSSFDIIKRISLLEYSLTSCMIDEDLRGAYKILVLIDTEIDFKLNKDQRKELDKLEETIYDKLNDAEDKFTYNGSIFNRNPKTRQEVIVLLTDLKRKISKLKYDVGLGMVDLSDPRYALLNG